MLCVRGACCGMCVCRLKAESTTSFVADRSNLLQQKKNNPQSTRVNMLQYLTKLTAVSSMLHVHPANPPPHDFAGLRRGLGGCQSTPPGRDGQCVRGACCAMQRCARVAPEHTARRRLFSLTGRRKKKNSTQSNRVSTKRTAVS